MIVLNVATSVHYFELSTYVYICYPFFYTVIVVEGWSLTGSTHHIGHQLACCTCYGWLWEWRIWWNHDWQGKRKYWEKTYPSATLSTTNPTWPDRARTRTGAVGSQWLTAWAMARPSLGGYNFLFSTYFRYSYTGRNFRHIFTGLFLGEVACRGYDITWCRRRDGVFFFLRLFLQAPHYFYTFTWLACTNQ
jgi:hypothetical protein